jgi:hypothetical protein
MAYPCDNLAYLCHECLQRFFVSLDQFFADFLNHRPGNERHSGHGSTVVIFGNEVVERVNDEFESLNNRRFNRRD